jgi:hypothetical protein
MNAGGRDHSAGRRVADNPKRGAMGLMIVRHKVKDYAAWRRHSTRLPTSRGRPGPSDPRVYRSADDEDEIVIIFDARDTKMAKEFAGSHDLKETMIKVGVADTRRSSSSKTPDRVGGPERPRTSKGPAVRRAQKRRLAQAKRFQPPAPSRGARRREQSASASPISIIATWGTEQAYCRSERLSQ